MNALVFAAALALTNGQDVAFRFEPGRMNGIQFDFYCDDPTRFADIQFDAQSGGGDYPLLFTEKLRRGWQHVELTIADQFCTEGNVKGWGAVSKLVFRAPERQMSDDAPDLRVENLEGIPVPADAEAVVVVSETPQGGASDALKAAATWVRLLTTDGVRVRIVSSLDLDASHLTGVRAVVAPFPNDWPEKARQALAAYVARGGSLLATDALPEGLVKLLGLEGVSTQKRSAYGSFQYAALRRQGKGLPGQVDVVCVQDWTSVNAVTVPVPNRETEVLAEWLDAAGAPCEAPALVRTGNRFFLSRGPRFGVSDEQMRLVRTLLRALLPRPKPRLAFWSRCWGMDGDYTWERSAKFLADNGFTDVYTLFGWAGCSFYASKVRPQASSVAAHGDMLQTCLAACRKARVKCHAFNVCWVVGPDAPAAYREQLAREGRLQKKFDGREVSNWVCPSHPANRRELIEVMVEYARLGVDGIQFDFIRHNGEDYCFCEKCRKAFEKEAGPVVDWPGAVRRDAALARKWERFRREAHTSVLREVRARLKAENLKVEVSAAVQPDPATVPVQFAQDWPAWCREGLVDTVCSMIYRNDAQLFRRMTEIELAAMAGTSAVLLPGISTGAFPAVSDAEAATMLADQMREARAAGCPGVALFVLDDMRNRTLVPLAVEAESCGSDFFGTIGKTQ